MTTKTVKVALKSGDLEVFKAVVYVDMSESMYIKINETDGSIYFFPHSQITYIAIQQN